MDAAQVIAQLAFRTPLPVEAIRSVEADRAAAVPIFLRAIESYLSDRDPAAQEALFFIFHLLGGWREKSAYRPLARLLRCHPLGSSGLDLVPAALPGKSRWYMPWRYGRWRGTNAVPADPA